MVDIVVEALILDLLEWLAARERTYEEVMEAWRTSCPRLPVWEDANDRRLVVREEVRGRLVVRVTAGEAVQRLLKADEGRSRAFSRRVAGDVKPAGLGEFLGLGVASGPGHGEHDQDQRLEVPTRGTTPPGNKVPSLLLDRRGEKLSDIADQRLRLLQALQLPCGLHRRSSSILVSAGC